ncbi:hypothetical protein OLMES_4928 [Oleiphilus messinensis]|uniref:DUF2970 domain-containing protein n=1 Tax=Oleiphilus messinensis TaxID=141451 RepID=A0A1Y0IGF0_9GAMM|nr:DUF2970 domain-containing protein [Oleiphilus messinensis]ARU58916.1 hypothetical protein OLMES_4928 [Oleiphilus messinensis]
MISQPEPPPQSSSSQESDPSGEHAKQPPPPAPMSFWQTMVSVVHAMIGVQSRKGAEESWQQGSAAKFIIAGIIFILGFILMLMLIVKLVLAS